MNNYTMMVYDSRNTCIPYSIRAEHFTDARRIACEKSRVNKYPVTIHDSHEKHPYKKPFAKYENGTCTEASDVEFLS